MNKADENEFPGGEFPESEFGLLPETELWMPPDDCPQSVIDNHMPGLKQSKMDGPWLLFFDQRPSWWTDGYGLAVANLRRKQVYELWKNGELEPLFRNS